MDTINTLHTHKHKTTLHCTADPQVLGQLVLDVNIQTRLWPPDSNMDPEQDKTRRERERENDTLDACINRTEKKPKDNSMQLSVFHHTEQAAGVMDRPMKLLAGQL